MNLNNLKEAISEAERFIVRAKDLLEHQNVNCNYSYHAPKEQGSVKRASMDLTRALSKLRNTKE